MHQIITVQSIDDPKHVRYDDEKEGKHFNSVCSFAVNLFAPGIVLLVVAARWTVKFGI